MKYLIAVTLLLSSLSAFSFELKITKMTAAPGMDRSYVLHTKTTPDRVVLDCQSFVQGLTLGTGDGATFFMMEPQDCEDLFLHLRQSFSNHQKHCIEVDDAVRADYTCQ